MQSQTTATILKILALGEFVGDKLPTAPNRIAPLGVISRCFSGSLAGASIYKAAGNKVIAGALVGAVVALGATYGTFALRRNIVRKFKLSDPVVGAIEDTLVVVGGVGLALSC